MLEAGLIGLLGAACASVVLLNSRRDVVTVLTVYIALLWLLPAQLILPGLSAIGYPAMVVALGCAGWWAIARAVPGMSGMPVGSQPVRSVLFTYGWWVLLTYAFTFLRPLTTIEANGADRAIIALCGLIGVALLAGDGIESVDRLEVLMQRLVTMASVVALIGIVQFATDFDPVAYVRLPGLEVNQPLIAEGSRSFFDRPYATTLHPIEFSVICAMVLPLAFHYALHRRSDHTRRSSGIAWLHVVLIASAIPMSVSRSGVLGVAVGMVVLSVVWNWRVRIKVAVGSLFFLIAMRAAVPGLLGTLRSMIVGASDDPSIQGRLRDVDMVRRYISESPIVGRGPGTFNPTDYFFLDNQYYGAALETGLPGLLLLLLVVAIGVTACIRSVAQERDDRKRSLGFAIAAGISVGGVSMVAFDGFAFPIFIGTFFLMIGCGGCLWRLLQPYSFHEPAGGYPSVRSSSIPVRGMPPPA